MTDFTARRCRPFAGALLAATIPLAPALAQDRDLDREAPQGKVFRGEFGDSDDPARFSLTLEGGQAVELTAAQVAGSDPFLRVFDAGSGELLAENDDSAGSLSATVRLYSPQARRVRIEVTSAMLDESSGSSRFDLILRPSDYRPRPPRSLALGETLSGTLGSDDEELFRFRAESGQILTIAMNQTEGSGLDPIFEIFAGNDPVGEPLASDDDGGGGLDARVRFAVPRTGNYVVRAHGVSPSAGAFTISAALAAAIDRTPVEIDLDRPVSDALDGDTPERFYRLSERARSALASAPGTLVVDLRHTGEEEEALDPVVEVGFETPLGFSSVANDDDGGGGMDARVSIDVSQLDGTWLEDLRIKAGAFSESSGGYELVVTRSGAE